MSDVPVALEQRDVRQAFESAGDGAWTVLYQSRKEGDLDVFQWSMLAPKSLRSAILADINCLPQIDFGAPGFDQIRDGDHERTQYERFGNDEGFEPLVIHQDHYGVRPPMKPELSEEFRLYHNLWTNDGAKFVKVNDDGSDEPAAEIGPERVRVRTPLLRQFQAAKQLDLVLRISSYQYVDDPGETIPHGDVSVPSDRDDLSLSVHISDAFGRQRPCSVLDGTKVLPAPPREKAAIWPFDRREETHHDFIIGEDADGEPVKHTCDPEQLANYFGKNPDAPHYLTPVFFRREVLKRYYEQPRRYSIEGSYLSCGALWGLRLDNDHPDHVMVFLGDLGRDLPESERPYWQTFNISPTGLLPSRSLIRRAFLGEWADSEAPDTRFKSTYDRFNKKWRERFGWALFKEPEPGDVHVLQRLRVPLDDDQPEFENQVLCLAKVLVDALNETEILKRLPNKVKGERGISKLERWMSQEQYPSVKHDIAFLRRLQHLRSKVTAHRKDSDYAQVLADADVNANPIQEVATMLFDAERLLCGLAAHAGINLDSY